MSLPLYMDVHVPRSVTDGLRLRSVDILTAQEDRYAEVDDPILLARATALGRLLVTQDKDLLAIAADWQRREQQFAGIVYAPQTAISVGDFIRDLELIATLAVPHEFDNRVEYLPY